MKPSGGVNPRRDAAADVSIPLEPIVSGSAESDPGVRAGRKRPQLSSKLQAANRRADVIGALRKARQQLPGDPSFGDPLSVTGPGGARAVARAADKIVGGAPTAARAPKPISLAAVGAPPTILSAALATARAPPGPVTDSGSPNEGSPGSCWRALRSAPITSARRLAACNFDESWGRFLPARTPGSDSADPLTIGSNGMDTSAAASRRGFTPPEGVSLTLKRLYHPTTTAGPLLVCSGPAVLPSSYRAAEARRSGHATSRQGRGPRGPGDYEGGPGWIIRRRGG